MDSIRLFTEDINQRYMDIMEAVMAFDTEAMEMVTASGAMSMEEWKEKYRLLEGVMDLLEDRARPIIRMSSDADIMFNMLYNYNLTPEDDIVSARAEVRRRTIEEERRSNLVEVPTVSTTITDDTVTIEEAQAGLDALFG